MRSHLHIFLFSSLALSALGQTFENFPAVGGSRPSAPLRSSSPQSRPPGNRVNVQNTRANEVEPQQEERRVNRNKGRSRSRGKAPAPARAVAPSRASAPSRGASAVRESVPSRTAAPTRVALRPRPAVPAAQASQPENRRGVVPRRRPQEISQPEVERENTNRVRVRPTTTPVPTTRKFVPAFLQEPAGQSLDQAFGNIFNSEQTRPATRPTPIPTRPTVRPTRPTTQPTTPPPTTTTRFTQPPPPAPIQTTSTPFVFLPADSFQSQPQPKNSFTAFPAAPRPEILEPKQPAAAFQTFQAQPQQEQFQPRQSFQPQQPARAALPPQRRPKVVDQMFDSSSLFSQDITAPQDNGDGVYFSYSAIL